MSKSMETLVGAAAFVVLVAVAAYWPDIIPTLFQIAFNLF